ncbi:MAG: HypC/HybG/HupF family hydrogenase formation chaperone [Candidatus Micrarchaeota archaeon]
MREPMCLAIPGKIVSLKDGGLTAVVDYGAETREANNALQNAKPGEWVLVQFKAVVDVLSEDEAREMLKAWEEIRT